MQSILTYACNCYKLTYKPQLLTTQLGKNASLALEWVLYKIGWPHFPFSIHVS